MHQELYTVIKRKSAQILISILAGLIVLEVIFNKGFFSSMPNDIYSFVLLLFWAIFLSIPLHALTPYDVDFFFENLVKELNSRNSSLPAPNSTDQHDKNINGLKGTQYKVDSDNNEGKENDEEEFEDLYDEFRLGFVILNSLFFYLLIKVFNLFSFLKITIIGIPYEIYHYTMGVIFVFLFRVPLGKIYTTIVRHFVIKYFDKEEGSVLR